MSTKLIPLPSVELVKASDAPYLLDQVRPAWQAKSLIERVRRLIDVDPSSACQRLLNAAIHDLREKVLIAGLDIAGEAAKQNSLPAVNKAEDIENYSTAKLIDLAYRIGLLSRPEWRRVHRCYEIRRDLEHEDDEYEAGVEDCIYIFKTCVEVILARDPIHVLRVTDVKVLIEQATAVAPSATLLQDYERAPQPRQEEISKFLVAIATDKSQSDLVQQNAYSLLTAISSLTQNSVKLTLAAHLQEKINRGGTLDRRFARVASAAGVFPYLKQSHREDFFEDFFAQMERVSSRWSAHSEHGELLRTFAEFGGLQYCPPKIRKKILKWLCMLYIGEPGGRTSYGNVRNVFYSNVGAPLAAEIIASAGELVIEDLKHLRKDKDLSYPLSDQHVARRYEGLLDLVETGA
jgi:hypothetical protein